MMKPILYILILFPLLGLSQNHVGKYFGTVENDSIGKIDITFELNQDSTYEITAQFDYYGINEGHCFDGQTWKYFGTWLWYKEYIFFKPCTANYEPTPDGMGECTNCCEFPNGDFDFLETFRSLEEREGYEKKKWYKIFDDYYDLGFTNRLKVDPKTKDIYFHFAWDCHEEIWNDNQIKKIE
ncbi:MAG TPA: hypothetical protein VKY82_07910 [Flavobacterium sp.]|nr:hypothetical protein [Flavobacterium sp.]